MELNSLTIIPKKWCSSFTYLHGHLCCFKFSLEMQKGVLKHFMSLDVCVEQQLLLLISKWKSCQLLTTGLSLPAAAWM